MPKPTKVRNKLPDPKIIIEQGGVRIIYPNRNWGVDDYFEIRVYKDARLDIRGHDGRLVVRPELANKVSVSLENF